MLAGTAENVDIGSVIGQAVGGGVAGAIVTFVVGLIKKRWWARPRTERQYSALDRHHKLQGLDPQSIRAFLSA